MTSRGRPRAVPPAMLAEAANELFLERGYHHTSVDDIAQRAGISRATFFNTFPAKADVLFVEVDDALSAIDDSVAAGQPVIDAIVAKAETISHADRPLIATQAETMAVLEDVWRVGPARVERLRKIVATDFPDSFEHWQITAAIVSATLTWATNTGHTQELSHAINHALSRLGNILTDSP